MASFRLISSLLFAISASSPVMSQGEGGPDMRVLTILHTNDIHGHLQAWVGWQDDMQGKTIGGFDRIATVVKQVRNERGTDNVLVLDAGDTLGDTQIAVQSKGQAILKVMNAIGYDAMAIGNHEPDFTAKVLAQLMEQAHFPILAANIKYKDSGKLFATPYVIQEVAGTKVGILGLAYPNNPLTTSEKNIEGLEFTDAAEAVREFMPKMKQDGAELIVVLSHYGLGAEKKLAKQVKGIDVIVGGHSHNRMTEALKVNNTLIVQAGAHGSDVGRLDLQIKNGKVVGHERKLIMLDHEKVDSDEAIAALMEHQLSDYQAEMNQVIAKTQEQIIRTDTIAGQEARKRDKESPVDSLFADIIRENLKTDVAILPGVGYGVALPKGDVTVDDLRNLIPHDSHLFTLTLTGKQIRSILEQSLRNTYTDDPDIKVGGLVQVSGLSFAYNAKASYPHRIKWIRINNEALQEQRDYRVATNSLLAHGGHRYKTFLEGRQREKHGLQFDVIKKAFQSKGEIKPPSAGRIQRLDTPAGRAS